MEIIDQHFLKSDENVSFSGDTIYKVETLIRHIGGNEAIDPNYEDSDDSIAAFAMFVIKDYITYCGIWKEKKENNYLQREMLEHKLHFLEEKEKYL